MNLSQTDDDLTSPSHSAHRAKMHSWNNYDWSQEVHVLCMQTAFSYRNAAAVRSCYLDDSSNELSSPVLWCCAVLSSSFESLFSDLAFPSELIRWKVVGGIASINILFAEIKAVFLWWKCILGCFANFHLFHSRALPAPVVSAASPRHNLMSVRVRECRDKHAVAGVPHIVERFHLKVKHPPRCVTRCFVLIEFYDGMLQVCPADRGANLVLLTISLIQKNKKELHENCSCTKHSPSPQASVKFVRLAAHGDFHCVLLKCTCLP